MPSNAQNKTSGSKAQTKTATSKNTSRPTTTKDAKPILSQNKTTSVPEIADAQKTSGKATPVSASADSSGPRVSHDNVDETSSGVGVNRKKQKRRQKEAARKAADQPPMSGSELAQQFANVADSAYKDIVKGMAAARTQAGSNGYHNATSDYEDPEQYEPEEEEVIYYRDGADRQHQDPYDPRINGHNVHDYVSQDALGGKAKKKKKAKANSDLQDAYSMDNPSLSTQRSFQPSPPPPPPSSISHPPTAHRPSQNHSKDRIWNTSTAEERERIKEFWLSLGENDRRSLVKVEKEAVLRKMKEQQKHSCSCTVCGRKRTAIEEELEVLYDAYYEELEVMPPTPHHAMHNGQPSRGRIQELGDDEETVDVEEYSDEEDEDDISDDELDDQTLHPVPNGGTDFFNFGKSLTVQGGILTVADDLLKNDGKKFIEMMEQLAERRMQREEEQYARAGGLNHPPLPGHNHNPPADDDTYDDEEDDEEYDEDDEEYDEDDEMESMTELDRMKEGRRMFQIFAARMFEQRVLTAYREKVALERQKKLLEELDDESKIDAQREAKKAKEAQKKKDKKRQQKEAKDAEKAKREAEKAAEEAAAKAAEEKKAEEVRQRKEEQRKKREAEKKAQEEEKQRKEAEKQKRLQEAKEHQAEQERKQRDQKEREKKKREEMKKKEREEREAKEQEAKAKKDREAAEKKQHEQKVKAEADTKERVKQDAQLNQKGQPLSNAAAIPMPPGLHPPVTHSSHTSPRLQIATPVIPKAPTPARPRQQSFQEAQNVSPKTSQLPSSSPMASPKVSSAPEDGFPGKPTVHPSPLQPSQASSRYSPATISPGQPLHPPGLPNVQTMSGNSYPSAFGPPLSPTTQHLSHHPVGFPNQAPVGGGPYRNFMGPNGMPGPPGISGPSQMNPGRGGMMGAQLPHISTGGFPGTSMHDIGRYGMSRDNISSQTHSRNTSGSFDKSALDTPVSSIQAQSMARPAPIKRPSSVTHGHQNEDPQPRHLDVDDLSNHLGSSALLDDSDTSFISPADDSRRGSTAQHVPRTIGQGFGTTPGFSNPIGIPKSDNLPRGLQMGNGNSWPAQQSPFGAPPMSSPAHWSSAPGFNRAAHANAFGSIGGPNRGTGSRAVTIRLLVRTACEKLTARSPLGQNMGWHHADDILREVQSMKPGHEAPVPMIEMLEICDTEGNGQNGGGSFSTTPPDQGPILIRYDPGRTGSTSGRGAGDIGSPIVGGAMPAFGGQRPFQQPGRF